jgi:hypothetical protein
VARAEYVSADTSFVVATDVDSSVAESKVSEFTPKPLPKIKAGDVLGISVPGSPVDQPIHGLFRVEASGNVALGASYGRVFIGGMDAEEAEREIASSLRKVIAEPRVSVTYDTLPGAASAPTTSDYLQFKLFSVQHVHLLIWMSPMKSFVSSIVPILPRNDTTQVKTTIAQAAIG